MNALQKKSSLLSSAFFVICLGVVDTASANVNCNSIDESLVVSRSDVTKRSNSAEQAFAITGSQSKLIINQSINLDIGSDLSRFDHSRVVKSTEFIWQVDVTFEGAANDDYITAAYQFNGLTQGDNKICSGANSCLDVVQIRALPSARQNLYWLWFKVGVRTRGRIELTLDLSNAKDSGVYRGNLQVELFRGSDSSGGDGTPLSCDNL
ncbi:hypothetical protein [Kangiella spongicola]|uniref:Uncharacterized protein n=1 Tax=Kangiella spongicola TaxID=796379 RepID=A0A318DAL7_9GAMM|nr:hypothetical protein [Kangiella spongicola]PXF63967.1 hypothetical protein DL796_02160 [Kangiella spongicola]